MKLPDPKKRTTMKDVAQAAGVSTQTVSRVINNVSYVSAKTRHRVEAVIEELGYRPSTLARSLSQQRSYTLGVVVFGLVHIGPALTLNGIADAAEKQDYMLLMKELDDHYDNSTVKSVIDSLISHQVDGIIWAAPEIGNSHSWMKDYLDSVPVPIIFLAMKPREDVPSVTTDNYQGAVLAVHHLLDTERKKIAHLSGPLSWWEAAERKQGWIDTLLNAGLDVSEEYWTEGDWSAKSGELAFIQLLEKYPEMDAIFVANDQMALSVLQQAHLRGVSIPDELSVIGFDNIDEAEYFFPALTTIEQDFQLLGETAVRNLVEMIDAQQKNISVQSKIEFIEPKLIIRKSTKKYRQFQNTNDLEVENNK